MKNNKALVLFSGGQDSTTCLYWAINKFGKQNVETLNIFYGQRHSIETIYAEKIAKEIANVPYQKFKTTLFQDIGDSALVQEGEISKKHRSSSNLPASFVPGRNILFLTIAAALAYKKDILNIVTGVCQTDFSGYPDCRATTIDSLETTLLLAMERPFKIHTPLMYKTKKETVEMAQLFPGCMEALAFSHTCYEGLRPPCQVCPACKLRIKGFKEAGINDPLMTMMGK